MIEKIAAGAITVLPHFVSAASKRRAVRRAALLSGAAGLGIGYSAGKGKKEKKEK